MSKFGDIFKNYRFTLNSRILLYFILILSISDLIYFSLAGEMMFFFIYLVVGFLTSFFSKNMIVILVVAMTVTHILRFGKSAGNEGMENQDDPISAFEEMKKDYDGLESKEPFDSNIDKNKQETAPAAAPASSKNVSAVVAKGPASAGPAPISAINKLKQSTAQIQKIKDNLQAAREKDMASPIGTVPASSLKNLMNTKVDSALAINNSTPVISGFENLDAQTKKLLNTQQELMSNMENLSPLLAQAEQFMAKFQGLAKA